ncbi:MAG: tat (twin-arginine translocation) pathway signal sequence, partial [Burkholderiales bacterium]|nr:tat (twin-arginine translocation) pathway signal sequence [Burkholderiales bacterium]
LAAVDAGFPVPFAERSEGYRAAALKALDGTAPFVFVQRHAVRFVYDDREVWEAFGYEGAAVHLGGYLHRGFDDLDWLPPVPPEAWGGPR